MTDVDLLVFGCAVMFIVAAAVYVFARERFVYSEPRSRELREWGAGERPDPEPDSRLQELEAEPQAQP